MKIESEALIQQRIVQYFRKEYYNKGIILSIPNERSGYAQMKVLLNTGLLSGASDLLVVLPNKVMFVELKNAKGKQSDKQKRFEEGIKKLGHEYHLVRSLEEFKSIL